MRTPLTQKQLDQVVIEAHAREGGGQIYDELRQILCILNLMDVKSMIEIGTENGGSLSVWQKMWDSLAMFAVDMDSYGLGKTREERENRWSSWLTPKQSLDVIWGNSHSLNTALNLGAAMTSRGFEKVDLLYVDGDHSEAGIEADFKMYSPFVRPGGLVLMTDIHPYPGRDDVMAYKFWNRLKPVPISQDEGREPHPRPNWQAFDVYHDKGNQKSFGWAFLFV